MRLEVDGAIASFSGGGGRRRGLLAPSLRDAGVLWLGQDLVGEVGAVQGHLADRQHEQRFGEEFAELDEAGELLDVQDQKHVKEEKKSQRTLKK